MNLEMFDRPYGVALYIRDSEGVLHRVGGFKDEKEAEEFVISRLSKGSET